MRRALAILAVAHVFVETAASAASILELAGIDWSIAAAAGSFQSDFGVVRVVFALLGI